MKYIMFSFNRSQRAVLHAVGKRARPPAVCESASARGTRHHQTFAPSRPGGARWNLLVVLSCLFPPHSGGSARFQMVMGHVDFLLQYRSRLLSLFLGK